MTPCDWDSNDAIICDRNGTVTQLDTHIYANDYKSTFENSWINLTFFPPNLQTLSFYKCGFQGNVDFKRFPLSIQSIYLSYNNFDLIFDTHNDTKMQFWNSYVNLEYLSLEKNDLDYWANILKVLPPHINTLDLEFNKLNNTLNFSDITIPDSLIALRIEDNNFHGIIDFRNLIISDRSAENKLFITATNNKFESVIFEGMPKGLILYLDVSVPCDVEYYCVGKDIIDLDDSNQCKTSFNRWFWVCTSQNECEIYCGYCCDEGWVPAINDGATVSIFIWVVTFVQLLATFGIVLNRDKFFHIGNTKDYQYGMLNVYCYLGVLVASAMILIGLSVVVFIIFWSNIYRDEMDEDATTIVVYGLISIVILLPTFVATVVNPVYSVINVEKKCKCIKKIQVANKYTRLIETSKKYAKYYWLQSYNKNNLKNMVFVKFLSKSSAIWVGYRGVWMAVLVVLFSITITIYKMKDLFRINDDGSSVARVAHFDFSDPLLIIWIVLIGVYLLYLMISSKAMSVMMISNGLFIYIIGFWFYKDLFKYSVPNALGIGTDTEVFGRNSIPLNLLTLWITLFICVSAFISLSFLSDNVKLSETLLMTLTFYSSVFDLISDIIVIYLWLATLQTSYAIIQSLILLYSQIFAAFFINDSYVVEKDNNNDDDHPENTEMKSIDHNGAAMTTTPKLCSTSNSGTISTEVIATTEDDFQRNDNDDDDNTEKNIQDLLSQGNYKTLRSNSLAKRAKEFQSKASAATLLERSILLTGFGKLWFGVRSWAISKHTKQFKLLKIWEIMFESFPTVVLGFYVTWQNANRNISVSILLSILLSFINITWTIMTVLIKDRQYASNAINYNITSNNDGGSDRHLITYAEMMKTVTLPQLFRNLTINKSHRNDHDSHDSDQEDDSDQVLQIIYNGVKVNVNIGYDGNSTAVRREIEFTAKSYDMCSNIQWIPKQIEMFRFKNSGKNKNEIVFKYEKEMDSDTILMKLQRFVHKMTHMSWYATFHLIIIWCFFGI